MKSFLLSIIVPVYNVEQYLSSCVNSILKQTFSDYELILVDDGSNDGSGALCDALALTDSRIRVIHQKNQGQSAARNAGIRASHSSFIAFVDSDDELGTPTTLEENMKLALANPEMDFIQFPLNVSYESKESFLGVPSEIRISRPLIIENFRKGVITCIVCDKIYRSSIFDQIAFTEGRFFEDVWFMVDLIKDTNYVICSPLGYYKYKVREGSTMTSKFTERKYIQQIETRLKTQALFTDSHQDDVNQYILALRYLVDACKFYDIESFKHLFPALQAQRPSLKMIGKCYGNLHWQDIARLLLVKLVGVNLYLKIVLGGRQK